jgi:DNA-binding response OmpR family regulator
LTPALARDSMRSGALRVPNGHAERSEIGSETGARMSAGRVLVVDDEPEVRQLLEEFLTVKGYDVAVAEDGAQALEAVERFHPQVVLLDMTMPGMDGQETLRRMVSAYPTLPVIMVTANVDVGLTTQVLTLGAADYVPKPFDLDYLDQAISIQLSATRDT